MATSNHLRSACELMLIADLKEGFIDVTSQLVSHATRLKRLLSLVAQGRRTATEIKLLPGAGPLERLDTIYTTQWAIVERPQRSQLVVSAVFDTSWEAYFRNLQLDTGEILDAFFMHCEGYEGHSCVEDGYDKFTSWIRSKQIQTSFFHVAMPDMTVADLRYLRKLRKGEIDGKGPIGSVEQDEAIARAALGALTPEARRSVQLEHQTMLQSIVELDALFPATAALGDGLGTRSPKLVYQQAIRSLLASSLDTQLKRTAESSVSWLNPLALAPAAKAEPVAVDLTAQLQEVQGNILQSYNEGLSGEKKIDCGCLLMLQCDDAAALRDLLGRLAPHITDGSNSSRLDRGEGAAESERKASELDPYRLRLNLGLTFAGLARLELEPDVLHGLPPEFREGMDKRAGLLGDVGSFAHPSSWEVPRANWPDPLPDAGSISLSSVDVVLLAQRPMTPSERARDAQISPHLWSKQHPLREELLALLELSGTHVLHVQALRRYEGDHFELGEENMRESQPVPNVMVNGARFPAAGPVIPRDLVPLGELLLGHENRHALAPLPDRAVPSTIPEWVSTHKALFENGTFVVLRKLHQDVPRFKRYMLRATEGLRLAEPLVKGWILGRQPDGRTLVAPGGADPGNDFDYSSAQSAHCPFHSHVRRANPRLGNSAPRIMRRSFAYGSRYDGANGDEERGLLFMAYNASIAEQFETVQRWISGGNVTGLASADNDLLAGVPQTAGANRWGPSGGPQNLPVPDQPFVSLRWGMYLFMPSLRAIRSLAEPDPRQAHVQRTTARIAEGQRLVEELSRMSDEAASKQAWKELIEQADNRSRADAVWAYVRSRKERLPTPYGFLAGTVAQARDVLKDDGGQYSVEIYYRRLSQCFSSGQPLQETHYLGLDRDDKRYAELSGAPNRYLLSLPGETIYGEARAQAAAMLALRGSEPAQYGAAPLVSLSELGSYVAAEFALKYLGLPVLPTLQGNSRISTLNGIIRLFVPISRYCFQPWPESERALAPFAFQAGSLLRGAYEQKRFPLERSDGSSWGEHELSLVERSLHDSGLAADLRDRSYPSDATMWAMIGAITGFAPPAIAHVVTIVRSFLEQGEIARLRRSAGRAHGRARHVLLARVWRAMLEAPTPPVLYRSIRGKSRAAPTCGFEPPPIIVLGTRSVALDAREEVARGSDLPFATGPLSWLLGGPHGGAKHSALPAHGCPGKDAAVAVIAGLISALLDYPELQLVGAAHLRLGPRNEAPAG